MKIAVTGASGFVGRHVVDFFRQKGDEVVPLSRHFLPDQIEGSDVVIHLAGENVMGRWTQAKKQEIKKSRLSTTEHLCKVFKQLKSPPSLFICASAVGYYGNRGEEKLTENSSKGTGYLSDVCEEWEKKAQEAQKQGIRCVNLRIGVVFSKEGGALKKMLLPFKLGLGGVLGSGQQYISWVALEELVEMMAFIIQESKISGPVNAVSLFPMTNEEQTKILGRVLKRPTFMHMPEWLVKLIFGELGEELFLSSARVVPEKLEKYHFPFSKKNFEDFMQSTPK